MFALSEVGFFQKLYSESFHTKTCQKAEVEKNKKTEARIKRYEKGVYSFTLLLFI
jgi:hypothetical protein